MTELRVVQIVLLFGVVLWAMRRIAGRLAPRVMIAPIVFLATRLPVLVVWALGTAGWLALLIPPAIARGHDGVADWALLVGISLVCGLGGAVLVVGPLWALARAFAPSPTVPLEPGEILLEERAANHFLGAEARGGRLLLTSRRLAFRPHRFNVQLAPWSVRLEDVRGTTIEGERFLVLRTAGSERDEWIVAKDPARLAEKIGAIAAAPEASRAAVA